MSVSVCQYCLWIFLCVSVPLADDQISVKVNESGWAWMVCGEKLIIWKICQTAVAKVGFTEKIQKLKTQVAKQNIHLPVQRVHREKKKLERQSQNLLDMETFCDFLITREKWLMRRWKVGASVCPVCIVRRPGLKHMNNKTVVIVFLLKVRRFKYHFSKY